MTLADPPGLRRALGLVDAVTLGVASMVGAGVFAVFGPAARSAGEAVLLSIALAALVAVCNAASSVQLAVEDPRAGGAYVWGRRHLGAWPGFVAGWCFVLGKSGSCAAIALVVADQPVPAAGRAPVAIVVLITVTLIDCLGVRRTATAARLLLVPVLVVLAVAIAVAAVLLLYLAAATALLQVLGSTGLASTAAPWLRFAAGHAPWLEVPLRSAAVLAAGGSLLALVAGVSRTAMGMAREHDLPGLLAVVHPRSGTPVRAAITASVIVLVGDLRLVVGFSSCAVLLYYAVANLAALRQSSAARFVPGAVSGLGLLGCAALAATLPPQSVVATAVVVAVGCGLRLLQRRRSGGGRTRPAG